MTSFVSTATTMFGRFPGRHARQKEPSIGSPVLVNSSRPDVLLLSGDNEKGLKMLPPLPNELDSDFSPLVPARYTTTPNFETSPIMPSHLTPPAFYHIAQPPAPAQKPPSPPPHSRKNVFSRKPMPPTRRPSTRAPKSVDIMQARSQSYQKSTHINSISSIDEEKRAMTKSTYGFGSNSPKQPIEPTASSTGATKAPRLRDSIVPVMKPLDRTFFGDTRTSEEFEEDMQVVMHTSGSSTTSTALSPRLLNEKAVDDLNSLELLVAPKVRKAAPTLQTLSPKSDTGAPMVDVRFPLTPMLDRSTDLSPSIMLSLVADDASREVTPPSTPPSMTADEHIAQLELERDRLVVAQRELMKDMNDIEAVLPPNPSTHDIKQRKQLKQVLGRLQLEYDGVGKELHETGMLLHRAWRRRDVKLGLEAPAVLWVRRVSN